MEKICSGEPLNPDKLYEPVRVGEDPVQAIWTILLPRSGAASHYLMLQKKDGPAIWPEIRITGDEK